LIVSQSKPVHWETTFQVLDSKLDLPNCFLSFPLHPKVRNYFIFCLGDVLYRFVRMPFGLTCIVRYGTQPLSVVAYELTGPDCVFVRYLDDFLFIAATQQDCQRMLDVAIATFTASVWWSILTRPRVHYNRLHF